MKTSILFGLTVQIVIALWADAQSSTNSVPSLENLYKRCQEGLADCKGLPVGCEERQTCDFLTLFNLDPENVVELILSGRLRDGEWMALGVSQDDHMGDDTVYECWLDRNRNASIHISNNIGHTNNQWNEANTSALIQGREVSVMDGVTTCSIYVPQNRFNATQFVPLLARGRLYQEGVITRKSRHYTREAYPPATRLQKRVLSPVQVPKSTVSVSSASFSIRSLNSLLATAILALSILL